MSNNSYKEILKTKQQQSSYTELVDGVNEALENGYTAYKVGRNGKPETMLEINLKNNQSQLLYYFDIKNIIFEGEGLISIVRNSEIITIKGENLTPLKQYFRDNRVQVINEFNPAIHKQVTKTNNEPFIEEITITSLKTEKLETDF